MVMISDSEHDALRSLLGAYALDAVDDRERAQIEDHLPGCPRCRAEVGDHREVAGALGRSGAPAPEGLWDRIASELDGRTAPPLRLVLAGHGTDAITTAAPVVDRPSRRWHRTVVRITSVAASLLLVLLLAATVTQRTDIAELRDEQALGDAATTAFASPEARTTELRTLPDGNVEPGVVLARVALLPDGDGYMLADGLPDLDEGLYQLWGVAGDQVISLGALGRDPKVVSFRADGSVTGLMVTQEAELVERSENNALVSGSLA